MSDTSCTAHLKPFSDEHIPSIQLAVDVQRSGSSIVLQYQIVGDIQSVVLPARQREPERRDGLWEHTCFEAFLSWGQEKFYWELNVSPSGDWNLYHFDSYRSGQTVEGRVGSITSCTRPSQTEGTVVCEVHLELAGFLDSVPDAVELGLTAVIEQRDGQLTYWALEHLRDHPDFHVRESFSLVCSASGACGTC